MVWLIQKLYTCSGSGRVAICMHLMCGLCMQLMHKFEIEMTDGGRFLCLILILSSFVKFVQATYQFSCRFLKWIVHLFRITVYKFMNNVLKFWSKKWERELKPERHQLFSYFVRDIIMENRERAIFDTKRKHLMLIGQNLI